MNKEIQAINHWILSGDPHFLNKHNIDGSYFFTLNDAVLWINDFVARHKTLPTLDTVGDKFENFKKQEKLDPLSFIVSELKQNKLYYEYRNILVENSEIFNQGKTMEAIQEIRKQTETLLTTFAPELQCHDWVKDIDDRWEEYKKKSEQLGLAGLSTGIKALDDLTGGWREDDLTLITARLSEGKSLLGGFFVYNAWRQLQELKMDNPVIYISTEMPEIEVAYRFDTLAKHLSNTALNQGTLSDPSLYTDFMEEMKKKEGSTILILGQDANGGRAYTPVDIQRLILTKKPALICIDQLYDIDDGTGERDIRRRIVNATSSIRNINLATKTPILLIAQSGRDAAKNAKKDALATPELHEVQESDNPAQKATKVLTLRLIGDVLKMTLRKNRAGKKNQDIYMRVDIDTGVWEEETEETCIF